MKKLLEKARTQTGIEGIEIVGIGAQASTDKSITIRDSAGQLTAAVVLRLSPRTKLKDSSIEAEFCGICELDTGETVFHREVLTVAEYEDWLATAENNGLIAVPLIFQLPQNKQLPPSAKSHAGSIRYSIKCTISCLENFKLFRSNYEVETPVIVHVSDHIKTRMVNESTKIVHLMTSGPARSSQHTLTPLPSPSAFFRPLPPAGSLTPKSLQPNSSPSLSYDAEATIHQLSPLVTPDQKLQLLELAKLQKTQAELSTVLADMHGLTVSTTATTSMGSSFKRSSTYRDAPSVHSYRREPSISACDATDSTSTSSPIPHDSEREEIDNLISTYSTPLRSWSVSMVADWVKQFGVSSASVISFIEQEIDGTALLTLSGEDLRDELGVSALGTRRRLAVAIESLRTAHCQ